VYTYTYIYIYTFIYPHPTSAVIEACSAQISAISGNANTGNGENVSGSGGDHHNSRSNNNKSSGGGGGGGKSGKHGGGASGGKHKVREFTETKKQSPNTGARANNTLHK